MRKLKEEKKESYKEAQAEYSEDNDGFIDMDYEELDNKYYAINTGFMALCENYFDKDKVRVMVEKKVKDGKE